MGMEITGAWDREQLREDIRAVLRAEGRCATSHLLDRLWNAHGYRERTGDGRGRDAFREFLYDVLDTMHEESVLAPVHTPRDRPIPEVEWRLAESDI
ncbi:MAG: hypothetical protein SVU88_02205 [Candidatus Nanohaloarchaea archaeon]|nr:hypothetical protein [Candidatus Nanohaloarchaea archaeon]